MTRSYATLEAIFKKLSDLDGAKAVLHWDSAVMMPSGGGEARAEQLATLSVISHDIITQPNIADLLEDAEATQTGFSAWQQANLREMRRVWNHANAVDEALVMALSRAGSKCELVWRTARAENDFKSFAPLLKEVVNLVRQVANAKAERFGCSLYDALLDQFDPGRKSAEIDLLFADIEQFLPGFVQEVLEHQRSLPPILPLAGTFSTDKQKELGLFCMNTLGFDFNQGRLDVSHHPFCGGVPSDVRLTTRYDESDFITAMMGVEHETGHAMYENQLPEAWRAQPVGQACGMSIHESQSLLIEMQVCRSREFLSFILPVIRSTFGVSGKAWELDNLHRIVTKVEPGLIRVDADEVTYPAHILLRYKLEKAFLSGELEVEGLPAAWNEGMKQYLGIVPDSDRNGCMQDIHWTDGSFGYFPTYTLGAIHAAQFFTAAKKAVPAVLEQISKGNFHPLNQWLKDHIHNYGSFFRANDLMVQATGGPIDVAGYKGHLRRRYFG